jgi:hypothetical protein
MSIELHIQRCLIKTHKSIEVLIFLTINSSLHQCLSVGISQKSFWIKEKRKKGVSRICRHILKRKISETSQEVMLA